MLDYIHQVVNVVQDVTGVQVVLVLLVILFVEPLAKLTGVKDSESRWRGTVLGGLCLAVSMALTLATVSAEWRDLVHHGLVLGGLSTLMYQIGKPVFKFLVLRGYEFLRDKFGGDLPDPEM